MPALRRLLVAATLSAVAAAVAPVTGSAGATPGPPGMPGTSGRLSEDVTATLAPPGSNDVSCRPSAAHPFPVVLVHGTFANSLSWTVLAPVLAAHGYCVFALDYGNNATAPVAESAVELAAFVDQVLAATGAHRVSIVGHSQGGMMPRQYLRFLGGTSKVDELVGLAPSNHGTTNPLAGPAGVFCAACTDQQAGSSFLTRLNAGHDVEPGVDYTVVATRTDLVVTPFTSQFLSGPSGQVTNVTLQDRCPIDLSGHVSLAADPVAAQWVLNALGRDGPANPGFQPFCTPGLPV